MQPTTGAPEASKFLLLHFNIIILVVWWSEFLTNNHEVPGSIPSSTVGIFPEGQDSRGDHGLGRLVEFRFKGPPGTPSSSITTHIIGTM
jgi:hypothetical protein